MGVLFKNNKFALFLFIAPLLLVYCTIIIVPLGQAFIMSFTNWDGVNAPTFAGLNNYRRLFISPDLGVSLRNSIIYSIFLSIYQISLGTIFASILSSKTTKFRKFFKDVYFFPVVLSVSVVAQLWISIYHGDSGLVNQLAKALGSDWRQNWLNTPIQGILAIVFADSWKGMGYHMLIIYAAVQNVPQDYFEASTIDGATGLQQFFHITIPLISSTLKVCLIMCFTFGFRAFETIFIMTGGGPGNYSNTMSIMMYKALFGLKKYGYSNAIAVFIVVICVVIMQVIERIFYKKEVQY